MPYDIVCSKETFNLLKADESFLGLLTLARAVNAMRFCQKAGIDSKSTVGPAGARSRINSFLFAGSVLYQGFITAEGLGKHFRHLDSYKEGFQELLNDSDVQSFRKSVLHRMRNKFVFHFDRDVAKESLGKNFDLKEYKFASGIGDASGEMYFGLADEAAIHYLLDPTENESNESLKARFEKILEDTTRLMGRFTDSGEKLMADVLSCMGFTVKKPLNNWTI